MVPLRLDRAEIARRLEGAAPRWVLDPLLDAFEAAALAAMKSAAERRSRGGEKESADHGRR